MWNFHLKNITLLFLIVVLVCSLNINICNARVNKHYKHKRPYHKAPPSSKPTPTPVVVVTPPSSPKAKSPPYNVPIVEVPTPEIPTGESVFSVLNYGAVGDGTTDDTQAFQDAWEQACKVQSSTMLIPYGYQFLVGPISFSGPYCQKDIIFQVDGTIVAPTNAEAWSSDLMWWMDFTKLVGLTIQGKGTIDGSGSVWWNDASYEAPGDDETQMIIPLNDTILKHPPIPAGSQLSGMSSIKPTAVRFYGSINVTVTGITIQNSPQCHLKFDNCVGVTVYSITISSPGDSPNTDGIHLQNSQNVLIHSSSLGCGDDCISIQSGCSNVYVHNVNCGPGHGISIGSLGRFNTRACVSNVTVRDVSMHGTMTGVRIKTWQGGSGSVQGILFSNIQMNQVQLPIVIDQYYCDKSQCRNETAAVAVSGVTYQNIKGTYTVKPVHLACSDDLPCTDITLNTIQLSPLQGLYRLYDPFCWQSFGGLTTPIIPPIGCLQVGKPLKNRVQTDTDVC
ncbi:polygalacturonase At1g48100 isoform X2 [Silene latifolia]|uniref:polygalacturonase At1g48100 isoform X2 n=1 Tax=Silene latifolia TaxID=37657 RepID=UPI003D770EEB